MYRTDCTEPEDHGATLLNGKEDGPQKNVGVSSLRVCIKFTIGCQKPAESPRTYQTWLPRTEQLGAVRTKMNSANNIRISSEWCVEPTRWGDKPPYMDTSPSSLHIALKHWKRPVYFSFPPSIGLCRNLVRTTSCGYVSMAANSFALPAAPSFPPQSTKVSQLVIFLPLATRHSSRLAR